MKQIIALIFIALSFVCPVQAQSYGDIDFKEVIELKGLLYLKADTTLVTGRVIRYNKKREAKRFIMVNNGKPDILGWNNFNSKYESPKESPIGNLVSATVVTTGVAMALSANDINSPVPMNYANQNNHPIINIDANATDLLDYNQDIAYKAQDAMSKTNEITQNLQSKSNPDKVDKPIDEQQATATKGNPIAHKRTGERKRYYSNGQLESKGIFIKGNKEGLWEVYHTNGQLKSMGYYTQGKKDGLWQEYYKNGLMNSSINYKNGKEDGLLEVFHENGKLLMKGSYKDGKQIGEWNYYDVNGVLSKTENFKE